MSETFKRNKEDFTCEQCGFFVVGSGYTNHCPKCLYSKHVDINPGDRKSTCGGKMKPIRVEGTEKEYIITHKCLICGHLKRNKVSKEDSIDELAKVAKNSANDRKI
jgi:rubrerythrin